MGRRSVTLSRHRATEPLVHWMPCLLWLGNRTAIMLANTAKRQNTSSLEKHKHSLQESSVCKSGGSLLSCEQAQRAQLMQDEQAWHAQLVASPVALIDKRSTELLGHLMSKNIHRLGIASEEPCTHKKE